MLGTKPKITTEPVWRGGARKAVGFRFLVIDGTHVSRSIRVFASRRSALQAGRREFRQVAGNDNC